MRATARLQQARSFAPEDIPCSLPCPHLRAMNANSYVRRKPMTGETMTTATFDRPTETTPATTGVETMRAIVQDEYGTAPEDVLRLADVARPTIGDDEVLVRVRAASVERGTWHAMAGLP